MQISRVVQQLQKSPYYLFLYLDALVHKDSQLVTEFADIQVKMYAEFATPRLIDFLRASSSYNLETVCKQSFSFFVPIANAPPSLGIQGVPGS